MEYEYNVYENDVPEVHVEAQATQTWKVIGASVRGPQHCHHGVPRQDAFAVKVVGDWLIAAVCDGAGSAAEAEIGAETLSLEVVYLLEDMVINNASPLTLVETTVCIAVVSARNLLSAYAEDADTALRPFHATLVGVLAGPEGGCFFHIGDGSAIADTANSGLVPWSEHQVSPPENGEYANETYFFTLPEWRLHLRFTPFGPARSVVLMSDGTTSFAMHKGGLAPDQRFLGPVCRHLELVEPEAGATALAATLRDPRASAISGDDKTLLWACRTNSSGGM